MKALFEISCTQDFQILFSNGRNSEKGHNLDMKKIGVNYFFMRNTHMKFQNPNMHHSEVNTHTDKPNAICPSNLKSWGHKQEMLLALLQIIAKLYFILPVLHTCNTSHYENLPMQYMGIFSAVISENFDRKILIFLYFCSKH